MKNLYGETARERFSSSRVEGKIYADVAIIGGGYTGVSTALYLAEQGIAATVIEAVTIGHGASGRNGGQVNPGIKILPDDTEAYWGNERGARILALAGAAPDEVFHLIEKHKIDCNPVRCGTVCAVIDQTGLRYVGAMAAQSQSRGGPVTFVDAEGMWTLTGTETYLGGAIDPRGGHVNPLAYVRGLSHAAQRAGAKLYERSPVHSLVRKSGAWEVSTPDGIVQAKELVVATNGYTGNLWPGLVETILPVYTYIVATDPLPIKLRHGIIPAQVSLYEAAWDVIYCRLDDTGRLLVGGRGAQRPPTSKQDYKHLIHYAEKLWPQLKGFSWPWHWYGQVAITMDHFPHLTVPESGVHLMLGYNGRGIAMATVSGRLVAQRIASGGSADIDLPIRAGLKPILLHRFWRKGVEITMGWNEIKDKLRGR